MLNDQQSRRTFVDVTAVSLLSRLTTLLLITISTRGSRLALLGSRLLSGSFGGSGGFRGRGLAGSGSGLIVSYKHVKNLDIVASIEILLTHFGCHV